MFQRICSYFLKFSSKAKALQVGNGANINILFNMSIVITNQGQIFEIYATVSELHDNVDLVLGVKNFIELEAELSKRELKLKFLNRSVSIFPVHKEAVKPKKMKFLNAEAPFLDEISGLSIIKLLGPDTYDTLTVKVKFERNEALLGVANDSTKVIILDSKRPLAILDIRSLGCYKIHQGVCQQWLSKYYSFESLQNIFKGYNNFRNKLQ